MGFDSVLVVSASTPVAMVWSFDDFGLDSRIDYSVCILRCWVFCACFESCFKNSARVFFLVFANALLESFTV